MHAAVRKVSLLAAAALFLALVTGCNQHLLATHDVRLDYAVQPPADLEKVRYGVLARLGAARITAEVKADEPDVLHVTVDEQSAEGVDELLTWRGGLRIYRLDPSYAFEPASREGLNAKTFAPPGQRAERYFVGDSEAVFHAVRGTPAEPGDFMVVDTEGKFARTRAVVDPPLLDLEGAIARVDARGKLVVLGLTDAAERDLRDVARSYPSEPVALVRDRSVIAMQSLALSTTATGSLLVRAGDDLYAYTRAQQLKRLLATPVLPPLRRTVATRVAPNWPLALASLLLPVGLSFAWLFFVRRFDRARPEPMWLVLLTFAAGGLSVVPAGLAETVLPYLTPYLNPTLMTLGGQVSSLPVAFVVFTIVVGLSEEGSKLLGAWIVASRHREFDEPVDGIVYGASAALGFAAVENIRYFAEGRMGATMIASRAFMTVPAHLFFGSIWGYALGRRLVQPKTNVLGYLLLAAALHGAFDTFLSIDGMGWFAGALNLVLASVFILLLRSALTHGAVGRDAAQVDPMSRTLYRMGSRGLFSFFAVGMHVVAALIFALGAYAQSREWRVGLGFVLLSSGLLGVLGLMAYGVSEAIPLDVAVDDHGITFGGATVRWRDITGCDRRVAGGIGKKHEVLLHATDGVMCLGPGEPAVVEQLSRTIAVRLSLVRV